MVMDVLLCGNGEAEVSLEVCLDGEHGARVEGVSGSVDRGGEGKGGVVVDEHREGKGWKGWWGLDGGEGGYNSGEEGE